MNDVAHAPRGMDESKRKALTEALSGLVGRMAEELRGRMLREPAVRARAERLHRDERVGEDFEVWTDLLSRRAAVTWVLKSVYVRVLEDRGLCSPRRIVDTTSPQLFARLAPDLGETAYLRWVYRDLAQDEGGLPELFALQPAEIAFPSDALSRELIDFWQQRDPDTGALRYRFDEERFDGRLMGDLYQDLDPVVKDRFALLQTPDFILDFILDETLTPAIAEFGVDEVRVLDPACGSGHFLLEAFRRLVTAMREAHPERSIEAIVPDVLSRVVGIDLNDYACGLARARLVMTALETLGSRSLADASELHPQVYWADGLEQVERDTMEQTELALGDAPTEKPRASLTQPEVRVQLRPLLKNGFHAVVGNPPYITEKDAARKEYHREKIGKSPRYVSAYRTYSLGAPFTERMFQLCVKGGFVGEITANSFMKREFGKALIEQFFPRIELTKVVDTSGAFIPGHGTPTVLLFGRNAVVPALDGEVPVVMGKRGEPGKPDVPAEGHVWSSIERGHREVGYEDEYISLSLVPRATLATHPWSIGGGGAAELKEALEVDRPPLSTVVDSPIGRAARTGDDDAFSLDPRAARRSGATDAWLGFLKGEDVRDWGCSPIDIVFYPYVVEEEYRAIHSGDPVARHELARLWPFRTRLAARATFQGKMSDAGLQWYEYMQYTASAHTTPSSITFGEVATHNHFALDRGGKVFKQTAPVIKLPADATEEDHLVLLAQLNSSTACFWLKQVCQSKGFGSLKEGRSRRIHEPWVVYYQFGGTKLQSFPLARTRDEQLVDFARRLDELACQRQEDSVAAVLATHATKGAASLRSELDARRERDAEGLRQMVGLQEELDWYCYQLYGVDPDAPEKELRAPEDVPPLTPGERAFEITLAREDAEHQVAVAAGRETEEALTTWFEKHGWEAVTKLANVDEAWHAVTEARLARTAASRELGLLEQPNHKRRWYRPDYDKEEREALGLWLADRIEAEAETRSEPFTVRSIAAALQNDPAVEAVAALYAGRGFDLDRLVADVLAQDSVPNVKVHVLTVRGLVKRAAWERTWELQHAEDAWEAKKKAHDEAIAAGIDRASAPPLPDGQRPSPEVPPKYRSTDFQEKRAWEQRGPLDVAKERFIAYTELPAELTEQGQAPRYGWAGWDALARAQVLLAFDEEAEEAGVPLPERYGLLWGVQFLLPYIRWGDDKAQRAAREFAGTIRHYVGDAGVTEAMLAEWAAAHPPLKGKKAGRSKAREKKA